MLTWSQSAYFTLSAASISNNLNLAAEVSVDAYGMSALNWTINLCEVLGGLLCPLPVISFTGSSINTLRGRDRDASELTASACPSVSFPSSQVDPPFLCPLE